MMALERQNRLEVWKHHIVNSVEKNVAVESFIDKQRLGSVESSVMVLSLAPLHQGSVHLTVDIVCHDIWL